MLVRAITVYQKRKQSDYLEGNKYNTHAVERPGPQIGKRQMPGQRQTKREIKLIKSFVKINSRSVHLAAEICPVVRERRLRRAATSMTKVKFMWEFIGGGQCIHIQT